MLIRHNIFITLFLVTIYAYNLQVGLFGHFLDIAGEGCARCAEEHGLLESIEPLCPSPANCPLPFHHHHSRYYHNCENCGLCLNHGIYVVCDLTACDFTIRDNARGKSTFTSYIIYYSLYSVEPFNPRGPPRIS
jgi:hypothetical protein